MKPQPTSPDFKHADMSPEAIDRRLRELAQIYKLGMSLRDAKWLGPIDTNTPGPDLDPRSTGNE